MILSTFYTKPTYFLDEELNALTLIENEKL